MDKKFLCAKTQRHFAIGLLTISCMLGCGCASVNAQDINNYSEPDLDSFASRIQTFNKKSAMTGGAADISGKDFDEPTLDYLNKTEQTYDIKDTDGNVVSTKVYPKSAYTLTADESGSVVLYEIDKTTHEAVAKTYKFALKETTYGDLDGSESLIYDVSTPSGTENVTYRYNSSSTLNRITTSEDIINGNFIDNSGSSNGGAIYNYSGTIGDITGDFINNYVSASSSGSSYGGAIYNNCGTIGDITGNFINNSSTSSYTSYGGAIYNYYRGTIGDITGNFINNYTTSSSYYAFGGAIYNRGTITSITGDFINNYVSTLSLSAEIYGGAISNVGTISSITGDFINNHASASSSSVETYGGAISNSGTITSITGDFINNYASSFYRSYGGAIYNSGTITSITGNFINNYATAASSSTGARAGGAIYNTNTITSITGNFINNKADVYGGAIYNDGVYSPDYKYNYGQIGKIVGDFINNTAGVYGGAIFNHGRNAIIESITGNFINNHVSSTTYRYSYGGAIYNSYGKIGDITGNFINNYVSSSYSSAYGGAIYNESTIGDITGNFVNNYASSSISSPDSYSESCGGAIYNYSGEIGDITGDFIENAAISSATSSSSSSTYGGAIYNDVIIGDIIGNFTNNYASSSSSLSYAESCGGAIFNYDTIGNITGNFVNNYASASSSSADSYAYGGAIYNEGEIGDITGDFINNNATSLSSSYSEAYGGAIDNEGTIGSQDEDGNVIGGLINSSLLNNYAKSENGSAYGGAIYTTTDLNLIADNKTVEISGNYTDSAGEIDDNAIYVDGATLTFKLDNTAKILMKDNVRGANYSVNIVGDSVDNTTFYMLNDVYNANLSLGGTTINTINNEVHEYNFNKLTLSADTNMVVDVDLANAKMDRFTASEYGKHQGYLNVVGMNLISDMKANQYRVDILFAETGLKDYVNVSPASALSENNLVTSTNVSSLELPSSTYQDFTYYTPIYKYNATYDNREDGGYYVFTNGNKHYNSASGSVDTTGNVSENFNPAILTTPVATQASAQATMTQTITQSFQQVDAFSIMSNFERMAEINRNKYAIASTDYDSNISYSSSQFVNKAGWFKPYTSFDTMNLKNGPKVNSINYGSFVGFDTDFKELKRGWTSVGTGYLGYNGSQLHYSGTSISTNGGVLGYTETFYKGNFWTAVSLSAGATVGESHNMYGKDNFTSLMAGVGSKTGYNFEFKDGRFIIQPSLLMSYSFVNTFDYTNAAGVKIDSEPMHTIQINPTIRLIGKTSNHWHPYASVGMVWNLLNETNVNANGVKLPEMTVKPYVEYGVGIQKHWADKLSAYGQVMLRGGGRNGVALSFGFRWAIGKDSNKQNQKVQSNPSKKSATLSQKLDFTQKLSMNKSQTSITPHKAVIKHLSKI